MKHKITDYKINEQQFKCPYCSKIFNKKGIGGHIWRKHEDGLIKNKSGRKKGCKAWNKGLTKETDIRIKQKSINQSKKIRELIAKGLYVSNFPKMPYRKRKELSIRQSLHNTGGKCKWFEVEGQKVQGTWERNIAILFEYLHIKWKKLHTQKDIILYSLNKKQKSYTPDFYLPEFDLFLEIKGYWWGNDKQKMEIIYNQHTELKNRLIIIQNTLYKNLLSSISKEDFVNKLREFSVNSSTTV